MVVENLISLCWLPYLVWNLVATNISKKIYPANIVLFQWKHNMSTIFFIDNHQTSCDSKKNLFTNIF